MAQKYTLASGSSFTDRLQNVGNALIHLSDGTPVFLYYDGTNVVLAYSSDHVTVNAVVTLSGFSIPGTPQGLTVCRDSADNIYVAGADSATTSNVRVQAFLKGTGYTWTAQTALAGTSGQTANPLTNVAAVWCNTGGGTGSHGHLLVSWAVSAAGASGYATCDAGAALAGSGVLITASAASPGGTAWTFINGSACAGSNMDIASDGFGATTVMVVGANAATTLYAGSVTVNSIGTVTGTTLGPLTCGTLSATTKVRVIRYAANVWAVVYPSTTSGHYMVARYSSTAQLTGGTDSGAPTNMALVSTSLGWDAFRDPVTANRVWVMSAYQQPYRVSVDLGSGVAWATAAVADDTLSYYSMGNDFRAVKQAARSIVDWQAFAETASTPIYALLGDYTGFNTAPNAPTGLAPASNATVDRSIVQRLSWTFSDPDTGDSQSKFDLQWRHKGTADAWNAVSQTTPNNYWDAPASTFPAEQIEWQVRTYDQSAAVGPWSALAYFTAGDPATPPTITAPVSGGTVSANPTAVTWSTAGQQGYQVRRVRDNAGVADTTTVYYDTGQITDTTTRTVSVPFEMNNRWEWVQVRVQQGGLWSAWSSIRVNVSYTQPATATLVAAGNNTTAAIIVTVTNPTPSGGQPTVTYNDVYVRAVGDTSAGTRIATGVANNGTATYWTPASGVAYEFLARTFGSNSTSTDSAWTA